MISGRVKESTSNIQELEVQAPVGVCPFPHGMTSLTSSEHSAIPSTVEHTSSPSLVQLLEDLDSPDDSSAVDYMALADEVEKWLAQEELLRNQ